MERKRISLFILALLSLTLATSIFVQHFLRSPPRYASAVETEGSIAVYWDENCTQTTYSINWGALAPGKTNHVTVYTRNEGNETILLAITALDWNPQNASNLISFSWSCQNNTITPRKTAKVDLALSLASSPQPEFSTFSVNVAVQGTPSPAYLLVRIASPHDSPSPTVGDSLYDNGSSVTCKVTSPVAEGGVSYTCTGWSGTGSVPSTGSGTSVTFTLTQNSTITWNWKTGASVHDVAITNLTSSNVLIPLGYSASFGLFVEDQGAFTETFNVTLYANDTIIKTQTVTLTSGNSTHITFIWRTSGFAYGNYTLSAHAWPVPGETDLTNNNVSAGVLQVTIPGDLNGDFQVNLSDMVILAKAYGSTAGDAKWNPNADIDGDGAVGLSDLTILAQHYGQLYP